MHGQAAQLPTLFQQFIHMSKYARWLADQGRRETWVETVDRYLNFMCDIQCAGKIPPEIKAELRNAILNQDIMPSMRAMMTAGPALQQNNVAGFNCSALMIDHPYAFDEMLVILMNGTGVGFSVERQFICNLPSVPEKLKPAATVIVVEDSKEGWGLSLRKLIECLYAGHIPTWDMSKVRPAGARLKTFGGRASGPDPLDGLFHFVVEIFKNSVGRRLNSIECHDICCKIADIVVVGGVRRAATISLSNPSDDRMRHAKSGEWWVTAPYRRLANNSACYTEKPDVGVHMREWVSIYESKSGERGIVNRVAMKRQVIRAGRREANHDFIVNPCLPADTWVLTTDGARQVADLIGKPFMAIVDGEAYPCRNGFFSTGIKPTFMVETDRGYSLEATGNHRVLVEESRRVVYRHSAEHGTTRKVGYDKSCVWKAVEDLQPGDKLVLGNNNGTAWGEEGEEELGWLVGEVVGDGGFNPEKYPTYVRFWGEDAKEMADYAADIVSRRLSPPPQFQGANENDGRWQVGTSAISTLCTGLIEPETKALLPALEMKSASFLRGFIRGFFDSDGSPQGNLAKGRSVRLSQANLPKLKVVQRILSRLGIASTIPEVRRRAGLTLLPDGKGGHAEYPTKDQYELIVARNCLDVFAETIGFRDPEKEKTLDELCWGRTKTAYEDTFTASVTEVKPTGEPKEVYDAEVDEVHRFDANGIVVHNCAEVILRSCEFCNLSEVVVRSTDTEADLNRKLRLATILGTMQASLTDFKYLRDLWKKNTVEEALLGVSLTGIYDNPMTYGHSGRKPLAELLERMKAFVIGVNKEWAAKLGINQAKAITTVKPSGTVSSLVNSASGIHPRFSKFYIRRARADKKDPLAKMMAEAGFPHEDDVTAPAHTWVFSFPIRAPKDAVVTGDVSALDQLELWKVYHEHWTEHQPSITINIREPEWMEVGAWVYKHFDIVSGIAFQPATGHVYKQMPYEEIDEKAYLELEARMPKQVDWMNLKKFEKEDGTLNQKTMACTNGESCDIVDIER